MTAATLALSTTGNTLELACGTDERDLELSRACGYVDGATDDADHVPLLAAGNLAKPCGG